MQLRLEIKERVGPVRALPVDIPSQQIPRFSIEQWRLQVDPSEVLAVWNLLDDSKEVLIRLIKRKPGRNMMIFDGYLGFPP